MAARHQSLPDGSRAFCHAVIVEGADDRRIKPIILVLGETARCGTLPAGCCESDIKPPKAGFSYLSEACARLQRPPLRTRSG